jgi:glutaredoxin
MSEQNNLELVMYARTGGCPYQTLAQRVLNDYGVDYRTLYIDVDAEARQRVVAWTGFHSVPTLVVAQTGEDVPYQEVTPLPKGASPSGLDRGAMLTEARAPQLKAWLHKHGFITEYE